MAATIKVANRMPRAVQIAPGVVLAGAQGVQPGITEGVNADVFGKWRETIGESISEDAIFEMKGDLDNSDKAAIAVAGGIADKPSTDAAGVSDPVGPEASQSSPVTPVAAVPSQAGVTVASSTMPTPPPAPSAPAPAPIAPAAPAAKPAAPATTK